MKSKLFATLMCMATLSCLCPAQKTVSHIQKSGPMKEFMLLIRVNAVTYTAEKSKEVNPVWNKVLEKWKTDSVFVTSFVFPSESYVLSGSERTAKKEAVVSDDLKVVSTIVLRAADLEEAVELAKACPVLDHGGTVEVREVQPRPVANRQ